MTQPQRQEQPGGDRDNAGQAAPAFSWFHRPAPGAVPRQGARPTPAATPPGLDRDQAAARRRARYIARRAAEPDKPASPAAAGTRPPYLTWDEIHYFVARDPDVFFDEDFYRDLEFDQAIDRDMELE